MFDCTKIARLLFGWQSYTFIENIWIVLAQGVFDYKNCAITFGLQSYSFVENYMNSLNLRCVWLYKNSATLFGWQSYTL